MHQNNGLVLQVGTAGGKPPKLFMEPMSYSPAAGAQDISFEEKKYWVALNMVLGIGKTLFHRLLRAMGSPSRVFQAGRGDLMRVEGIGEKTANEILRFDVEQNAGREFHLLEKLGARVTVLHDPDYPCLLKSIYDPPPVLYYVGRDLNRYPVPLAVVGSRLASNYGKTVTERLCAGLAEKGICLVSGMARGIDTVVHKSALGAGAPTVAVFGNGLAHTYPPENGGLRKRIAEQGTLLSEFPVSAKPDKMNFPARNRVISGLSYGTLVVEAGEKSGALITGQFALEQGREVFAVPGNIYSPKSVGANRLIKMGAKLVDGPEAVIEELPAAVQEHLMKVSAPPPRTNEDLSMEERRLLDLMGGEEKHIDVLIENSRLSPAQVSAALVQLELKGRVRQRNGKLFVAAYV